MIASIFILLPTGDVNGELFVALGNDKALKPSATVTSILQKGDISMGILKHINLVLTLCRELSCHNKCAFLPPKNRTKSRERLLC